MKHTIVILLDDQENTYTATGTHLQPWEAVRIAWRRIAKDMGIPCSPGQDDQVPPVTTPGEADGPRCPDHEIGLPSRNGGLYCPHRDEEGAYCKWTYGQVRHPRRKVS